MHMVGEEHRAYFVGDDAGSYVIRGDYHTSEIKGGTLDKYTDATLARNPPYRRALRAMLTALIANGRVERGDEQVATLQGRLDLYKVSDGLEPAHSESEGESEDESEDEHEGGGNGKAAIELARDETVKEIDRQMRLKDPSFRGTMWTPKSGKRGRASGRKRKRTRGDSSSAEQATPAKHAAAAAAPTRNMGGRKRNQTAHFTPQP